MIPLPLFFPMAGEPPDLVLRVQQLENALALSLELLHAVTERLESKLGPGFVTDEMSRLAAAGNSPSQDEVRQIDELLQQGQQPKAVRRLREVAGMTWDQAHDAIGSWGSYPFEQKVRWLQIAHWVQAFGGGAPRRDLAPEGGGT